MADRTGQYPLGFEERTKSRCCGTYNGRAPDRVTAMLGDTKEEANLEVLAGGANSGANAVKPARKVGAFKKLLRQFEATGNPPLQGEEVLPPKLIGDGNYHWYPLAWLRWLAQWERVKTFTLVIALFGLAALYVTINQRHSYEVKLPMPATELLLKSKGFDSFNQNHVEAYLTFVVNAANEASYEGMPMLNLLEGSIEPAIYLRLQQNWQKTANVPLTEYPINTLYITEVTRWRYNPATRIISACVKGFRMSNTLSGKGGMEPYRAQVEIFWEPMSNRNKWGYYLQRLDEFYGAAAEAYDTEIKNRDRSGF